MVKEQCTDKIVQFYNNHKLDILEHLFSKLEKMSHKIKDEYEGEWDEDRNSYATYKFKNNQKISDYGNRTLNRLEQKAFEWVKSVKLKALLKDPPQLDKAFTLATKENNSLRFNICLPKKMYDTYDSLDENVRIVVNELVSISLIRAIVAAHDDFTCHTEVPYIWVAFKLRKIDEKANLYQEMFLSYDDLWDIPSNLEYLEKRTAGQTSVVDKCKGIANASDYNNLLLKIKMLKEAYEKAFNINPTNWKSHIEKLLPNTIPSNLKKRYENIVDNSLHVLSDIRNQVDGVAHSTNETIEPEIAMFCANIAISCLRLAELIKDLPTKKKQLPQYTEEDEDAIPF